ncbi:SDR family NAD(P)-dependent oxidoreductase, partial [Rhizobiaceae sp. 2RAB30]
MADEVSILGLAGKVALVTGGGAGIGRATAELFARAGMKVAIAEISADRAGEIRDALASIGGEHLVEVADVRSRSDVERLIG